MSLYVLFPVGKETSAGVYLAFVNDPANCPDTPFCAMKFDKWGQCAIPYLGPGGFLWNGLPFPEPAGGVEARADGVLSATVEWPVVEDEI